MEKLITALAPVFAAGFAVQQLLELLTSFFDLDSKKVFQNYKKPILGVVAFGLGLGLTAELKIGVLQAIKGGEMNAVVSTFDFIATALIISAGTEGVNSILKFLKYSKEEKKREAAAAAPTSPVSDAPAPEAADVAAVMLDMRMPTADAAPLMMGMRIPTQAALAHINRQ